MNFVIKTITKELFTTLIKNTTVYRLFNYCCETDKSNFQFKSKSVLDNV